MTIWTRPSPMHRRSPQPRRPKPRIQWRRIVPTKPWLDEQRIAPQPTAAESHCNHGLPRSFGLRHAPDPRFVGHASEAWPWPLDRIVSRHPPVEAHGPCQLVPHIGPGPQEALVSLLPPAPPTPNSDTAFLTLVLPQWGHSGSLCRVAERTNRSKSLPHFSQRYSYIGMSVSFLHHTRRFHLRLHATRYLSAV